MRSGGNNFNYFHENLTKLANFVQFIRKLMFCLEDWGAWAPAPPPWLRHCRESIIICWSKQQMTYGIISSWQSAATSEIVKRLWSRVYHRRAVAQPCVNGDRLSKGRMAKFDPAQIRNPSTDRHKIWNRWLSPRDNPPCKISCKSVHWGLLRKWVKYNENFSSIYIPFFVDRPTGQTARRIFTHDGSNDAVSLKGQTFSGTEIRS